MENILQIIKNIDDEKMTIQIYYYIINDFSKHLSSQTSPKNIYQYIVNDSEFGQILPQSLSILDFEPLVLIKYYIYYQHTRQQYYNIFLCSFQYYDKSQLKYVIYYKQNAIILCHTYYHEKLQKQMFKDIDHDIACNILLTKNLSNDKSISIFLESFLQFPHIFTCIEDVRRSIEETFKIK